MKTFETRGVLAGAYRGKDLASRMVTHFYDVTDGIWATPKTLCGRIKADHLSDVAEKESATCPLCAERFERLYAKGKATRAA